MLLAFLYKVGWDWGLHLSDLILSLLILHPGGSPLSGKTATQYTFRVSFAFTAAFPMLLSYIRGRQMLSRIPKTWPNYWIRSHFATTGHESRLASPLSCLLLLVLH